MVEKQFKVDAKKYKSVYNAQSISEVFDSALDDLEKRRQGIFYGFKTRFTKINNTFGGGIELGTTFTFGGRPGTGKTAFAKNIIFDIPKLNKVPYIVNFFNWEMTNERFLFRYFTEETGVDSDTLKSVKTTLKQEIMDRIIQEGKKLSDYNIIFYDTPIRSGKLKRLIKSQIKDYPNHIILNVFDHTRFSIAEGNETEEQKITRFYAELNEIKKYKNDKGEPRVANLVLTQLNREIDKHIVREGYRAPVSGDIFGSDGVYQTSDNVALAHRPEDYNQQKWQHGYITEVIKGVEYVTKKPKMVPTNNKLFIEVTKNREGILGTILLDHDLRHGIIKDHKPKN